MATGPEGELGVQGRTDEGATMVPKLFQIYPTLNATSTILGGDVDKKKRNKPRNLRAGVAMQELLLSQKKDRLLNCPICATKKVRKRIANLKFEPPMATYRNVKKLERRRKGLIRRAVAKLAGRVA